MAAATSSAVPTNGVTRSSISPNWPALRLTAQPPTKTCCALRSDRRTDWRDLASASAVMQHVLMTCSSASDSGPSV